MELDELNIDLDMECPVCLNILTPPIISCPNSHAVCGDCFKRLSDSCPVCREVCGWVRCKVKEWLYFNTVRPCKYKDDGCKFEALGSKTVDHEKYCDYGVGGSIGQRIQCQMCMLREDWARRFTWTVAALMVWAFFLTVVWMMKK